MTLPLDIPRVKALLAEQQENTAKIVAVNEQYEAMKVTAQTVGMELSGAEWNLLVRAFEARTGRKELRSEEIRLNTEIKALTGGIKLPKLAVWQLLVKLEDVAYLIEVAHPAFDKFHDLFDWAEQIYEGQTEHSNFWSAVNTGITVVD